jgi:hypothetical protein
VKEMEGGSYLELPNGTLKKIEPEHEKPEATPQPTIPPTPPAATIPQGVK